MTKIEDSLEPSDNTPEKKDKPTAGANDMKIAWKYALDGSTVVTGPDPFGPIKKLKKAIDVKMNRITRPNTAIDNHSPALNIFNYSIFEILYFNIVKGQSTPINRANSFLEASPNNLAESSGVGLFTNIPNPRSNPDHDVTRGYTSICQCSCLLFFFSGEI